MVTRSQEYYPSKILKKGNGKAISQNLYEFANSRYYADSSIYRSQTVSKKSKKARRPNVPMYTGPVQAASAETAGGGAITKSVTPAPYSTGQRTEAIQADYTNTFSDLKRIGLLAGGLIIILVALSFFIK